MPLLPYAFSVTQHSPTPQDAVDHMVATKMAPTRDAAVNLGQQMVACGLFQHVCNDHDFEVRMHHRREIFVDVVAEI